ncbi:hypothetical protein T10_12856 [Trichinella papuae]|uniref:Uncharacterized protein n=1 Tax=Trichinella papuae TaxID=268474 RepID=A0A0V1MX02_9BILA|nr:hypothetical protein T10_12856 [Trichinella papuae]
MTAQGAKRKFLSYFRLSSCNTFSINEQFQTGMSKIRKKFTNPEFSIAESIFKMKGSIQVTTPNSYHTSSIASHVIFNCCSLLNSNTPIEMLTLKNQQSKNLQRGKMDALILVQFLWFSEFFFTSAYHV